jgi:hypothetical protein
MIHYSAVEIKTPVDDLFVSVNDIFEQYDEGIINYQESIVVLKNICAYFLKETSNEN